MNDTPATPEQAAATPEAPQMNFFQRLVGIYFEPKKTFEDINRKRSWVGIFIIVSVLAIGATYTLTSRLDHETYMRKALQMNPMTRKMTEEQIKPLLEQPPGFMERYGAFLAPINVMIAYLILGGIFLLTFILMGASLTFKKSFAVTIWAMGPPGIILTILGIVFMFVKDPSALELNPAANVASNLGLLVSESEHPVLNGVLSSIDLFSFWTICLLSLGFAAVSDRKLTTGKAATGILILWVLWVLVKAGFTAIFS